MSRTSAWFTINRYTGNKILKSPLKLIGAKTKIRDVLYPYFPIHDVYIEPFMGTAGVLIGKDKSQYELVGDLNEYVVNFFKVLQGTVLPDIKGWTSFERFWHLYQIELGFLQGYGRSRFEYIREYITDCHDISNELKAVWFYLITKTCMNGIWRLNKNGKCNSSYCGTTQGRGFMDRGWFDKVRERIQYVIFDNCDYIECLKTAKFESEPGESWHRVKDVFVFLDPPYSRCKTTYNGIGWMDEDFVRLRDNLSGASYKWLLTINDNEFIREVFKGYDMVEHKVFYSCSQTAAGRGAKDELLIANYCINETSHILENTSNRRSVC